MIKSLRISFFFCTFAHQIDSNIIFLSMKQIIIQTPVSVCSFDELDNDLRILVEKAKAMTQNAYCPYSHFHVGAAALLENGQMVAGSNQENAAYPSGLCAERTALFAANANYPHTPVVALAIACYANGHFSKNIISPCGACRQVMLETEHRFAKPMKIVLYGEDMCYIFDSAADLLPLNFVAENLQA